MKKSPLKRGTSVMKTHKPLKAKVGFKRNVGTLSSSKRLQRKSIDKSGPSSPKKTLDKVFSEYVRRIHTDSTGAVSCVTCGIKRNWNDQMDAGHFIPRQHMATRYDITNVFPQCMVCNRFYSGQIQKYTQYITEWFGMAHVEYLKIKAQNIVHDFPFEEKIVEYRAKLKELVEKSNGIQY